MIAFAERVLEATPAVLQLRAKRSRASDILTWLRTIRPMASARGVPVYANDRPDLAVLAGCDGVHVGQDDLHPADVRRFAPALRIGISTHCEAELREAIALRPDYVAFGPVFDTTSKERPDPVVGVEGLRRASELARAAGVPLVAIGGIDHLRARLVAPLAEMGAVIGALFPPGAEIGDTASRAARLHRALGGEPRDA